MRFSAVAIVTAAGLLSGAIQAADRDGNYAVWGMGNLSCHAYNNARASDDTEAFDNADTFRFYVMGYLTAYNVHQSETYSISAEQQMPDIMGWFDEYCDSHAVDSFENALKVFISEHYEKRMKTVPGPYGR